MEPRIQYAQTKDGVSIAFCVAGEGETLVHIPSPPWSHVLIQWDEWPYPIPLKPLAQRFRVVWYDSRGCGLSDRDALNFSVDAMINDLEAVVERLGLTSFAICAGWDGVPISVTYAAANPDRVSHLILIEGYTKFAEYFGQPHMDVELALRAQDWVLYTDTFARVLMGFDDSGVAHSAGEHLRSCAEQEAMRAAFEAMEEWDVESSLPHLRARTLVLHNRDNPFLPLRVGQRLAARIPDARLVVIDDPAHHSVPGLIAESLGAPLSVEPELPSGMTAILFADIAESTALTERFGDAAFRAKARGLDASLRTVIRECAGTPVEGKVLGDGVLAVFTSARQAIDCALRCSVAGSRGGLPLHVGIHAGDVIREGDNVYGGAVNIAARIAAASAPGEVLVSDTVRGLARTSAGVAFDDRGEHSLKGVADPQRLFAVRGGG